MMAEGGVSPMEVEEAYSTCVRLIENVIREIGQVEAQIYAVEEEIRNCGSGEIEKQLRHKENLLRDKENLLREKEKQLRDEKKQLWDERKEVHLKKPSEDSKRTCFQVEAKIVGAKRMKGIRAAVYRNAEEHLACYSLNHSRSIWYDEGSENLQITLLFENKDNARRFRTFLDHWYLNNPMAVKSGDVLVEKEIAMVHVPSSHNLIDVQLSDYVAGASDSPVQSLIEFMTLPSSVSSAVSIVSDMDDPLYKYQSLERPQEFSETGTKPYRCHLKPKAKFAKLANESNNQLAGTWLFHQWLDGLHTFADEEDDVPILALKPVTDNIDEVFFPGPPPTKRSRVDIIIEFRESNKADLFESHLKEGSKRIDDKKLQTFVHVSNPAVFCDCLQWKYEDTINKWNGGDDDSLSHS